MASLGSSTRSPALIETLRLIPGYDPFATAGDAWLDEDAALEAIEFFPTLLRHVEGGVAGMPFVLEPWQQAVVGSLFGWKRRDEKGREVRRYRTVFLYVPRKNGKTPLAAGICLYVLFCDNEPGAQIYGAASCAEQATMLFRHARGMVEREPELSSRALVFGGVGQRAIQLRDDQASAYKVISADAEGKHGGNSHMVLVDELHAIANRDLIDVLRTSMASENRAQPLMIYITTADIDRPSVCNETYEYACQVRDGLVDDPTFLPVIYEAAKEADWTDEATWHKANPNLGVSVSMSYLRTESTKAQSNPALENVFRRLHLNQRTQQVDRFISMAAWDASAGEVDEAALEGQECMAGLDLASTSDVAALAMVFRRETAYSVVPRFWVPGDTVTKRSQGQRVPYDTWVRQGAMLATPGNVVDYDYIRRELNELRQRFNVRKIAIDRWNATQIAVQLQGDGFEVVFFGQGFKDMTAPTKEFDALVQSQRLHHGGQPVLRWMADNLAVEQDAAGNVKPSKKKSSEKIDGIVATIMGIGLWISEGESKPSVYENRGLEVFEW